MLRETPLSVIFSKNNFFQLKPIINPKKLYSSTIVLSAIFYLFISIVGMVHIYAYNELLDDHGCSVGSLFCHGQTKYSTTVSINSPIQSYESPIVFTPSFIFSYLGYVHPKRGPPSTFFSVSS
jgi:hypothetical protein